MSADTSAWVAVTREDRETVGYLEPITPDYEVVRPRTLLGHVAGDDTGFEEAEALLIARGISELAETWILDAGTPREVRDLTLRELSPARIELADRMAAKALVDSPVHRVTWPDVEERLSRA